MCFNIFSFSEHLEQQALESIIYSFQTEKGICKWFSIQHILYAAFCDKAFLFNALSIPRSPYLMISEHPNEVHLCLKRTWNYNMLYEFVWKSPSQRKVFIHTPRSKVFIVYFLPTAFVASSDCCNSSWTVSCWVIGRCIVLQ